MGEGCEILIKLVDIVVVNAKLEIDYDSFFATDGPTNFIDNMAAFLGIDPSKIKIAKITQGSVIIDFVVIPFEIEDAAADSPEPVVVNSEEEEQEINDNDNGDN